MLPNMRSSYHKEDVVFLLRDLNDESIELSTEQRERNIQSGIHYSEMLPIEYEPSAQYITLYKKVLKQNGANLAQYVANVTEKVIAARGLEQLVLVSLARAGTPIGILMKRYIHYAYGLSLPHYTISILRDRGIDQNALRYILNMHPNATIQFIDGWTGKGAITTELKRALHQWHAQGGEYISDELAVIADPAYCVTYSGTNDDFLVPSACLNATVTGLVSRTVWHAQLRAKNDFHGAKFYHHLQNQDVSQQFIDEVSQYFSNAVIEKARSMKYQQLSDITNRGIKQVAQIQEHFTISNIHYVKPGIGETTRVLLRRVPWKILINPRYEKELAHIYLLAKERNVPIEIYDDMTYACCGLIKEL